LYFESERAREEKESRMRYENCVAKNRNVESKKVIKTPPNEENKKKDKRSQRIAKKLRHKNNNSSRIEYIML
jgi:hypothetical protein